MLDAPPSERNKEPIWEVLSTSVLPKVSKDKIEVLEIAAGYGVHTLHFGQKIEDQGKPFDWLPTDPEKESQASIDERIHVYGSSLLKKNVKKAMTLSLGENGPEETGPWSEDGIMYDLLVNINMIHISPWAASIGLMKLAGDRLRSGGILYCYGPYKENGTATEGNLNFDKSLRERNELWGLRNVEDVIELAKKEGLEFMEKIVMPANNLSLIFRKP